MPAADREYVTNWFSGLGSRIERREQVFQAHLKAPSKRFHKPVSFGCTKIVVMIRLCNEVGILPYGDTIGTPVAAQRPTRQGLAWIPFALPIVKQRTGRHPLAQTLDQSQTARSLHRSQGIDVPLRALWLVDADECRLAAHGQAYIPSYQIRIDALCNLSYAQPIRLGKRHGRPSRIIQTANRDGVAELNSGRLHSASDWRGLRGIRSADQGYVPLAGEQTRSRIQSNPPSSWQKRLCPGMQIRGVHLRPSALAFQRPAVCCHLN